MLRGTLVAVAAALLGPGNATAQDGADLARAAHDICTDPAAETPVRLEAERRPPSGAARRVLVTFSDAGGRPLAEWRFSGVCAAQAARRLDYEGSSASMLVHLDPATGAETGREPLNPLPPAGRDPGGVRVGHVDSGVTYTLPVFSNRLARTADGSLVGYDFWDDDDRPFDLDTSVSPFQPLRHGTAVAGILLREAPDAVLVPVRYPRPAMGRMADAVGYLKRAGVRIVLMPLGSNRADLWTAFEEAARAAPEMLFLVSAGNDGRDIDAEPVYPAAFELPNMVVVTSADDFGRLAEGSNWGRRSVDVMVPGEGIAVVDHRGAKTEASGSSFAVPRVAALAARLLAADPEQTTERLIAALKARARPPLVRGGSPVAWGWIPNPADDF